MSGVNGRIATIHLLIDQASDAGAADFLSETLSDMPYVVDWAYARVPRDPMRSEYTATFYHEGEYQEGDFIADANRVAGVRESATGVAFFTYTDLRDFLDRYTNDEGVIQGDPATIAGEAATAGLVERDAAFATQILQGDPDETTDRYGRTWPVRALCPTCGQPDNCGDCDHEPLSDEQVLELGGRLPVSA